MAKKVKYRHPGGVIGFPRAVLRSEAFDDLSSHSKALMLILQDVWKPPHEPTVHYSVRRVAKKLRVSMATASRVLKELRTHGFIRCIDESDWSNGQARTYRLTWLEFNGREPSNDWAEWRGKNNREFHQSNGRGKNRYPDETVSTDRSDRVTVA